MSAADLSNPDDQDEQRASGSTGQAEAPTVTPVSPAESGPGGSHPVNTPAPSGSANVAGTQATNQPANISQASEASDQAPQQPANPGLAQSSPQNAEPRGDLMSVFVNPDEILKLDLSPLCQINHTQISANDDKAIMRVVALVNHFTMVNKHLLGEGCGLQAFAATIGLTSAAKDVVVAQLLNKSALAVSGADMTTAANEFCTVIPRTDDGLKDSYTVHFRGNKEYDGEDADNFHATRSRIMQEIRGNGMNVTSDQLNVLIKSATETPPAYNLNTIGFMPLATGQMDPIFSQVNDLLNKQADRDGGIIIICHDVQRPLDATAAWLDLDVIKAYQSNPGQSKFRVIVARTKADLWKPIDYARCQNFKDVHDKIFGPFEAKLTSAEMFLVTGWRNESPEDEEDCKLEFEETFRTVEQRICQANPSERTSPWLSKLKGKIGTQNLIKHYHKLVGEQGKDFLRLAISCLSTGVNTLKKRLELLHRKKLVLSQSSLAGLIPDLCQMVEKQAMILRLNALERPAGAGVELDETRMESAKFRQTLGEEFDMLTAKFGNFLTSALEGNVSKIADLLSREGLEMNDEKHHACWARLERLRSNARTFAKMYEMPQLSLEEINAFAKSSTVRNTPDVEHFIFIHVLDKVKTIFRKELVPLFSHWIAYYVHQSYKLAFVLVGQTETFDALSGNAKFDQAFCAVLQQVYDQDICDLIKRKALDRSPAFLERINIERDRRESMHAHTESVLRWQKRSAQVNHADFSSFLGNLWPSMQTSITTPNPITNGYDTVALPAGFLNENPSKVYNPKKFLKLEDEEGQYLNELGRFFFSELLVQCILFYFHETQTTLDFIYTENRWDWDKDFLFKKLYFHVQGEAKSNASALLKKHLHEIQHLEPIARYQGYDMKQLLKDNLLLFETATGPRCADCGNPVTQQFCAETGQPHTNAPNNTPNGALQTHDDPFAGIVEYNATLPDFTYGFPAADVPGYRSKLHEDVIRQAKVFMADFFDDRTARLDAITLEAKKYSQKYTEMEQLRNTFYKVQRDLAHGVGAF